MEDRRMDPRITEETVELVLIYDRSGQITYANRAAREKLSYTGEELKGMSMSRLFWQEFERESGVFAPFDRALLEGKGETVIYRKNSSCFPVALRFLALEGGEECLLAEDITVRKNTDVRIREMKEQEENNKRERNEFTANVTHELRTPVNGIKGHVTTLLESVSDEEIRSTLKIILYCCDNMSSIINSILDFSKMEAGKFTLDEQEFDFYKMMDQVLATHTAVIKKKELRLSVYIDERIPQLCIGDDLRVGQILNNLLSNAIKFTTVGQISVDVSKTSQVNDELTLFFMVRDTGIGMSKEQMDQIFQSFRQADASITRRFGGTGLGLSITKQLVEMMNGTIHVESEKGKGSCFSFSIRLRTSKNESESSDLSETYQKLTTLFGGGQDSEGDYLTFGTPENKAELRKRMEKLILSIELGSWEKAETLAETIKSLLDGNDGDMKRLMLRMEMAVRKENYDKCVVAYGQLKEALDARLG